MERYIRGDHKACKEVLDSTEGRVASYIYITSDSKVINLTPEKRESKITRNTIQNSPKKRHLNSSKQGDFLNYNPRNNHKDYHIHT